MTLLLKGVDRQNICFELSGVHVAIANALRRVLIAEVPTVAAETVTIYNNTSVEHDEMLVQRLGLVPIRVNTDAVETITKDNPIEFILDVEGKDDYTTNVYVRDLQWIENSSHQVPEFPNPDILLAKLSKGQSIHLRVTCVSGKGQDHMKWSPVSAATHTIVPDIEIDDEKMDLQKLQATCPSKVFDIEDLSGTLKISPEKCTFCNQCEPLGVKVKRTERFLFTAKTTGVYDPVDLVVKGFHILKEKVGKL